MSTYAIIKLKIWQKNNHFITVCGILKLKKCLSSEVLETLENIDIIKINVDEEEELAKQYKIMSIPNILIIKDGDIKKQLIGFKSKEDLENEINNVK